MALQIRSRIIILMRGDILLRNIGIFLINSTEIEMLWGFLRSEISKISNSD